LPFGQGHLYDVQGRSRGDGHECWVAISNFEFAEQLLAAKPVSLDGNYNPQTKQYLQGLQPTILKEFLALLPQLGARDIPEPSFNSSQRWGAGFVATPIGEEIVYSEAQRILACGDYCLGSRFEFAAVSGIRAAEKVQSWRSCE
jgi:hypothetical protein